MSKDKYLFPNSGINRYVSEHIRSLPDLTGKTVLDIPCGDGRSSHEFLKKGATVHAYDLYPEFMELEELQASYADLSDKLPIDSDSIDYIICQEGIEHIPNQLGVLEEFNRVLKKNGVLLITTPSNSHLRARLSQFGFESDFWKRMPPTEIDSIWFTDDQSEKLYFGHLFLLGVQHLESLVNITGFETTNRFKTKLGTTSLLLALIFYPFLFIFSLASYFVYFKKNPEIPKEVKKKVLRQRVKLNLSPTTLTHKFIFWELRKKTNRLETIKNLKLLHNHYQTSRSQ